MKWMIASDIHGSAFYCEKMLKAFEREQADKLLLLGDILYHGPRNDLPKGYAPKKVIELLNNIKEKILCVRGNCDAEVDQMVLEFPIMADYAMITEGDLNIFVTHGHHFNEKKLPPMFEKTQEGLVLLHGHTHVPERSILQYHITVFRIFLWNRYRAWIHVSITFMYSAYWNVGMQRGV